VEHGVEMSAHTAHHAVTVTARLIDDVTAAQTERC